MFAGSQTRLHPQAHPGGMPSMVAAVSNGNDIELIDDDQGSEFGTQRNPLPLNLIMHIISYLDDPADLARACRTCRILNYMCLPALYQSVTLHSYDHIRYLPDSSGKPEGHGGGSPFTTALNALLTRPISAYVKHFGLWGDWREHNLEEYTSVGRVPDGYMMLNMMVRLAMERMVSLESFTWELSARILPVLWQGLATKTDLKSLKVRYSNSRSPMPMVTLPPMPSLTSIHLTHLDPLCYPDDLSILLSSCHNLQDIKMHWSSRMREAREPSVQLHSYFGKILAARKKLNIKSFAFQNLYAFNNAVLMEPFNHDTIESGTFIRCNPSESEKDMVFVDSSWKSAGPKLRGYPNMRYLRGDMVTRRHCDAMGRFAGLRYYYLITGRRLKDRPFKREREKSSVRNPSTVSSAQDLALSPTTDSSTPSDAKSTPESFEQFKSRLAGIRQSMPPSQAEPEVVALGADYIDNICRMHGATLKHLLLRPQWRLSNESLGRLVRSCPHLEQLGVGIDFSQFRTMHLLAPFLPRLRALRMLEPPGDSALSDEFENMDDELHERLIEDNNREGGVQRLEFLGPGDFVFRFTRGWQEGRDGTDDPGLRWRLRVRRVSLREVQHVEIWKMDRLEI